MDAIMSQDIRMSGEVGALWFTVSHSSKPPFVGGIHRNLRRADVAAHRLMPHCTLIFSSYVEILQISSVHVWKVYNGNVSHLSLYNGNRAVLTIHCLLHYVKSLWVVARVILCGYYSILSGLLQVN